MLAVGVGSSFTSRLGLALAGSAPGERLDFGDLEPLAALIQETEPWKLQATLLQELKGVLRLESLVAACSLANARAFGGQNYDGYHAQMALMPAYAMAGQLPERLRPLPVLKVVHRTAGFIQETGNDEEDTLRPLPEPEPTTREEGVARLRRALVERDMAGAETAFASLEANGVRAAYDDLQPILQENLDVHRVVLAWRAWEVMELTGEEHARTLLRQSVRFCIDAEDRRVSRGKPEPLLRTLLPELLEEHGLDRAVAGMRRGSDDEVEALSRAVFASDKPDAAAAVADALASGLHRDDVGEALSLASNALLLHDPGRRRDEGQEKPRGSVHGASVGVHACDSARAWRNIAAVCDPRNTNASLIAGGFHTAGQSQWVGRERFPYRERLEDVTGKDGDALLATTREAVEAGDQALACAAVQRYCDADLPAPALFELLLGYAISEDGALHAEKYYRTVCEDHESARPAFRTAHLLGLARVTASQHGWEAPGVLQAREALGA
jgi:hypothetical protein